MEHLLEKKAKEAVTIYSMAIALNDKNPEIFVGRAEAYIASEESERAIEDYTTAINLNRDYVQAYRRRGETYLAIGRNALALNDFDKVLMKKPRDLRALMWRALANEERGNFEHAIDDYKVIINLDAKNKEAQTGVARVKESSSILARLLQMELKRVGCDPGDVDGKWGSKSKKALNEFHEQMEMMVKQKKSLQNQL